MNQLQNMGVFVEVVERGGFLRAAHALRMAGSSVSTRVSQLEKHLGSSLINRTTRSFALTDDGRRYYAFCKRILGEISDVESAMGQPVEGLVGRLRVDLIDAFASRLLLPVLAEFTQRHPQISLDFVHSGHQFDAEQFGADIMIRTLLGPMEDSRLIAKPMGSTRSVCVASPDYLQRHGTPRTPQDLLQHRCIGFIDPWSGRHWEWFFEHKGERFTLDVPHSLAFSHGHVRTEAALKGFGIVNELECNVRDAVRSGDLKLILQDWSWETLPPYILYPQALRHSPRVMALVKFLLEKYPPGRKLNPPRKKDKP